MDLSSFVGFLGKNLSNALKYNKNFKYLRTSRIKLYSIEILAVHI